MAGVFRPDLGGGGGGRRRGWAWAFVPVPVPVLVLVLVFVLVCRRVCDVIVMGDGMGNGNAPRQIRSCPRLGFLPAMVGLRHTVGRVHCGRTSVHTLTGLTLVVVGVYSPGGGF